MGNDKRDYVRSAATLVSSACAATGFPSGRGGGGPLQPACALFVAGVDLGERRARSRRSRCGRDHVPTAVAWSPFASAVAEAARVADRRASACATSAPVSSCHRLHHGGGGGWTGRRPARSPSWASISSATCARGRRRRAGASASAGASAVGGDAGHQSWCFHAAPGGAPSFAGPAVSASDRLAHLELVADGAPHRLAPGLSTARVARPPAPAPMPPVARQLARLARVVMKRRATFSRPARSSARRPPAS